MESQFDELAVTYDDFARTPFRSYLESPTVFGALGDIQGKSVLDLGCGAGTYSRWIKERGAARVVGSDVSEGMLDFARRCEASEPLGIEYFVGDIPEDMQGTFDLVLAVYVLPYATNRRELAEICTAASRALGPEGRFVTLPVNPDFHQGQEKDYYERYGFRLFPDAPPEDGTTVSLELRHAGHDDHVTAYFWTRESLEAALRESGFRTIHWIQPGVSAAGLSAMGEEFWQPYLTCPHALTLVCGK